MRKYDVVYEIVDMVTNQRIKTIKFEIKADGYDSNNIFIERKCKKKESGVYATQTDFFLYILPRYKENNIYLVRPSTITNHLDMHWETNLTYAGDNNKSYGYLIDRFEFNSSITKDIKLYSYEFSISSEYGLDKIPQTNMVLYYGDNLDFKNNKPFEF